MKKVLFILSLLLVFVCTSCDGPQRYLSTGNYELRNVRYYGLIENIDYPEELKVFDKLKYELKRITEEEYEQANGQNVFIDIYPLNKSEKLYLNIEVYIYYADSDKFEKIECKNIESTFSGASNPYDYFGECTFKINETEYEGFINLCFSSNKSGTGTKDIGIISNEKEYVMNFCEINE